MGDYGIAKTEISKFSDSIACLKICFENIKGERINEVAFEISELQSGESAKAIYEHIIQSKVSLDEGEQVIALQMAAKISTKGYADSESSSFDAEIVEGQYVSHPKQRRVIDQCEIIRESESNSDDGIPKQVKDCLTEKRKKTMSGEVPDVI